MLMMVTIMIITMVVVVMVDSDDMMMMKMIVWYLNDPRILYDLIQSQNPRGSGIHPMAYST